MKVLVSNTLALMFSLAVFSQSDIVTPEQIQSEGMKFVTRYSQESNTDNPSAQQTQNSVYISQIGDLNKVDTYSYTSQGAISVLQNGDNNKAGLFLKAESIDYQLTQKGDNNRYLHFNWSTPELIKVNATQTGNNTDIIIHGKNSISEKIKIDMQGNDRALIIRNFN